MSEQHIFSERQEPTFYARIPKMATQELGPYELALYCHYKQIASDAGVCIKANATLATEAGMSVNRMKQARERLVELGFITVTHQADEHGNENQVATVMICDVWEENHRRYAVEPELVSDTATPLSPDDTPPITTRQGGYHDVTPKKNSLRRQDSSPNGDGAAAQPPPPSQPKPSPDRIPATLMNPMKDAIAAAFGWRWERMTQAEKGQIQRAAKELCEVGLSPGEVRGLFDWCKRQEWGSFGPMALPAHVSQWRTAGHAMAVDLFAGLTIIE